MSGRFDVLFLDFYGTISSGDREAVEAACRALVEDLELPMTPPQLAVAWGNVFFRTLEGASHQSFRTLHECEVVSLRETLAELGRSAAPEPYVAVLEDYWRNPPIYADALELLRETPLPTCCVSNADNDHIRPAVERHGLRFSAVVTSESARCYKPEPAIFERAMKAMGTTPDRVLHVGDSLHADVSGAAKLGITTVWLQRESRIHDIGTSRADHTISSLDELKRLMM